MHCSVVPRTATPWRLGLLLLLVVGRVQAQPQSEPDSNTDAAQELEPPTSVDPSSASDVPVTGAPGRGDNAVNDMKNMGVGAVEMVREMIHSGYAPADIAAGLRIYGQDTPDAAVATLRRAGLNPVQLASFLREGMHVSNAVIASALAKLGLTQRDIVRVLRSGRVGTQEIVLALRARGARSNEIAPALASAGDRPAQIASALKTAGMPDAQIVAGLQSLALNEKVFIDALAQAGVRTDELALALLANRLPVPVALRTLMAGGLSVKDSVAALRRADASAAQLTAAARAQSLPIADVTSGLLAGGLAAQDCVVALLDAKYPPPLVIETLTRVGLGGSDVVQAFKAADKRADLVAGLRARHDTDVEVARVLSKAGESADSVAECLEQSGQDEAGVAATLKRAGFACPEIGKALELERVQLVARLHAIKCTPEEIAVVLDAQAVPHPEIVASLKEIGSDRAFVARALKTIGLPAPEIAAEMRGADYGANDIAIALRLSGLTAAEVGQALAAAQFEQAQIPSALAYAGYKR